MKMFKSTLILFGLLVTFNTNAQKSSKSQEGEYDSKFKVSVGLGTATYYGDLMKKTGFSQPSYSFSAGLSYSIFSKFDAKIHVGMQKLRGSDSKSGGAHPERNLSFKSNVWDFALMGEYTILNLDKVKFSPYVAAGVGVVCFNPYAEDALGKRQYLSKLGTEGQGLGGYPAMYSTAAVEYPIAIGAKYRVNNNVTLSLDFNYRITRTDYLDDVSTNGYPNKALLDARNPVTFKYTYRGNEVGGPALPGSTLPRGNPDDNDAFFTAQLKLIFKL